MSRSTLALFEGPADRRRAVTAARGVQAAVLAMILSFAACGSEDVTGSRGSIRVAYPSEQDFADVPSVMAQQILERDGYGVTRTFYASPELAAQALAGGDADIAYGATRTYWVLAAQGAKVVTILQDARDENLLVVRSGIETCRDLEGGRCRIYERRRDERGAPASLYGRRMSRHHASHTARLGLVRARGWTTGRIARRRGAEARRPGCRHPEGFGPGRRPGGIRTAMARPDRHGGLCQHRLRLRSSSHRRRVRAVLARGVSRGREGLRHAWRRRRVRNSGTTRTGRRSPKRTCGPVPGEWTEASVAKASSRRSRCSRTTRPWAGASAPLR